MVNKTGKKALQILYLEPSARSFENSCVSAGRQQAEAGTIGPAPGETRPAWRT